MRYRFVYKNDGRWLKIDTVDGLNDYIARTKINNRFIDSLVEMGQNREMENPEGPYTDTLGHCILLRAERTNTSPAQAAALMKTSMHAFQLKELNKGNTLYINTNHEAPPLR